MIPDQFFLKIYRHKDKVFHVSDFDDTDTIKIHNNLNREIPFLSLDPMDEKEIRYKHFQKNQINDLEEWFGPKIKNIVSLDKYYQPTKIDAHMFSRKTIKETENLHQLKNINEFIERQHSLKIDQRWELSENSNNQLVIWTVEQWLAARSYIHKYGPDHKNGPKNIRIYENTLSDMYNFILCHEIPYYIKSEIRSGEKHEKIFIHKDGLSDYTKTYLALFLQEQK